MAADAAAAHGHEFSPTLISDKPAGPSMPSSILENSVRSATLKMTKSVMFEDVENDRFDCDGFSPTSSIAGGSPTRRSKSTKCTQTLFQLAHPPPLSKHKILRPHTTLLLQLQQISEASRPVPALDVLLSAIFAPRLARRCSRVLHGKNGLGHNDLVIVSSQAYEGLSESEAGGAGYNEDENDDHREVVAAICPLKKEEGGDQGKAEIRMNYGPSWLASPLVNGTYEFISTDECGVTRTARWVPRYCRGRRRATTGQDLSDQSLGNEKTFGFSIVNPDCRRHAIIATLTRHSIKIRDRYPVLASISTTSQHSASPSADPVASGHPSLDVPLPCDQTLIDTDEHLRTLIVVSGIWVAFREGYSQNFKYRDPLSSPRTSRDLNPVNRHRVNAMISCDTGGNGADILDSKDAHTNMRRWRTSPKSLHRSRASTSATSWPTFTATSSPRRANSTGTTFLRRASRRTSATARFPPPDVKQSPGDESLEQPTTSRKASACIMITQPWQISRYRKSQRRTDNWPAPSHLAPRSSCAEEDGKESGSDQSATGAKADLTPKNTRMKKSGILGHLFCFIRKASGIS